MEEIRLGGFRIVQRMLGYDLLDHAPRVAFSTLWVKSADAERQASKSNIHVPLSDQWTKARPGPLVHCKLMSEAWF